MDFVHILNLGVEKEIIDENQKNNLIDLFNQNSEESKHVPIVVKVFYYIGGFIMLCAMIMLMSHTIQNSTYSIILLLGTLYAILFLGVGEFLWEKNEKLPAGILYFLFITAFGFIVMDIEKMTGFFPHFSDMDKVSNYWDLCRFPILVLSSLTIIANTILQKYRHLSLLALPTIFCSYLIYITFIDFIYGWENITEKIINISHLIFFIGLTIVAFVKDRLTKVDYSKWMYFFGAIGIFMFTLTNLTYFNLELWQCQLATFILSLIYILIDLLIKRKPFSIIGALGVIEYIMILNFLILKTI